MDEPRFPLLEELAPLDTWVLNTYAGCDIRCRYCITAAQGRSLPRVPRHEVRDRLRDELDVLADSVGLPRRLGVGAFADVYPGVEAQLRVTRPALEVLVDRRMPFTLVTKGRTVLRDVDLFVASDHGEVQVSLCSVDDETVARLDPGAPSATERIAIVHQLAEAGVRVRVQASPWMPGVTDVAAIRRRVDRPIPITVTPLRIAPQVAGFASGAGLTQADVNRAFEAEYLRVGPTLRVAWSRPPALDGAPPHISDNIGRRVPDGWDPAAGAPNPGPPLAERRVELSTAHRVLRDRYRGARRG